MWIQMQGQDAYTYQSYLKNKETDFLYNIWLR
jgi:hypothetical protein